MVRLSELKYHDKFIVKNWNLVLNIHWTNKADNES